MTKYWEGERTYECPDCLDEGWIIRDAPQKVDPATGELSTFAGVSTEEGTLSKSLGARAEVAGDPIPGAAPMARPCRCNPVLHRRWREGHLSGKCGEGCVECQRIRDNKLSVGRDIDPDTGELYSAALA